MKIPFVDLYAQYQSIKEEIDEAISTTIRNTSFIGGEAVKNFESEFASFIGADHCIGCANGTDSMEIILAAMGVGPGDEVIVPANSWISTAEVVNNVGAEPVFVDVLEKEFTIDPELIEDKITDSTKAIIPVHLYGMPSRMNEIMAIAKKFDLKVIEDCAQAHEALYQGKNVGTMGDAASFSFYPGKNLGAYGDAGCIVTNDTSLQDTVRMIANHGQRSKHDHQMIGRNSRLDSLQASILSVKLKYLDKWTEERINNSQEYNNLLDGTDVITPHVPEGFKHVFHLYIVRVKDRANVIQRLKENQIGCSIHYPTPLPFVKAYEYKKHQVSEYPVSDRLSGEILSLPMYAELSKDQIEKICHVLTK